jgi:hypothetical protein
MAGLMGGAADAGLTRAGFSPPEGRDWGPVEASEGVWFAQSGDGRVGPFAREGAVREAERRNEYEVVVDLAAAILAAEGRPGLGALAAGPRLARAHDRRLAAAIEVLHRRGEHDGCADTRLGPVVLVGCVVAQLGPGGVVVQGHDDPAEAERNFEVLREEG